MIRCREFIAPIMLSVPEPIATVRYRSLRGPLCSKRNFRLGSFCPLPNSVMPTHSNAL